MCGVGRAPTPADHLVRRVTERLRDFHSEPEVADARGGIEPLSRPLGLLILREPATYIYVSPPSACHALKLLCDPQVTQRFAPVSLHWEHEGWARHTRRAFLASMWRRMRRGRDSSSAPTASSQSTRGQCTLHRFLHSATPRSSPAGVGHGQEPRTPALLQPIRILDDTRPPFPPVVANRLLLSELSTAIAWRDFTTWRLSVEASTGRDAAKARHRTLRALATSPSRKLVQQRVALWTMR